MEALQRRPAGLQAAPRRRLEGRRGDVVCRLRGGAAARHAHVGVRVVVLAPRPAADRAAACRAGRTYLSIVVPSLSELAAYCKPAICCMSLVRCPVTCMRFAAKLLACEELHLQAEHCSGLTSTGCEVEQ